MESQPPEEVPLPIPAPLKEHMKNECFWILYRQKLLRLPRKPSVEDLLRQFYYHSIATPTEDMSPALLAEVLDGIKIYFDFMTEDHLLYGPEREQYRLMVIDQLKTRGSKNCKSISQTAELQDNAATTTENSCNQTPHLEHTPIGNPRQPPHQSQKLKSDQVTTADNSGSSTMNSEPNTTPSQVYGAEHLLRLFVKFPLFPLSCSASSYTHTTTLSSLQGATDLPVQQTE